MTLLAALTRLRTNNLKGLSATLTIEGTSSKLYEIGTLLVDDSKKERLAINFLSIRKLITEARRRLAATNRNEGR